MATCTHAVTTASTSNVASYASGSFTPAAGDLLIGFVRAGATAAVAPSASMITSLGIPFSLVRRQTFRTSLDSLYAFVSNGLVVASAQTVTFTCTGDAADGTVIFVCRVSGMTRTGLDAILQSAGQDNQAAAGTPAPAFSSSASTGNVTMGMVGNSTNPATMTAPTNWTERADSGYATPTSGAEYVTRDSGFTGTTITWGGISASAFGSLILELDTTVPVLQGAQAETD